MIDATTAADFSSGVRRSTRSLLNGTLRTRCFLPDLRIAGAEFSLLDAVDSGRFFSDPLIDSARLGRRLSVYYPQKSSSKLHVLAYTLR